MQDKLCPQSLAGQDTRTDNQEEELPGAYQSPEGTAEEEQRQAKAAVKKAKKQRQKAKRQQAQGLTPELDSSAPQSLNAQMIQLQNSVDHMETQDSGSQGLQAEAQSKYPERQSNADDAMLDLFRCPITKVTYITFA